MKAQNPENNRFTFLQPSIYRLGLGVMLLLLLLAAFFWKERAWLLDVAFQTFLMIKDGTTQVMVYRFGAATVQSLPLLGIKLGVPLAVVSWLYSVSFHLHFLAFFLLAGRGFRRQDVAVGIALLYTAMTYDGFYWQTSELQQGLGFLLVSWAALLRYPVLTKWWQYALWMIAVIALAFYHPLVFMPFYFMLVWLWWKPEWKRNGRKTLLVLAAMMFMVLAVKQVWFQNWYDAQKTAQFTTNLKADFPNIFHYPAYQLFIKDALTHWWGYSILLVSVSTLLTWKKQFWGLAALWLGSIAFLLLSAIGDPAAEHRFYVEVNYYPLLAFVLVIVILEVFPYLREGNKVGYQSSKVGWLKWSLPILMIFFLSRLTLIAWNSQSYTQRVDYLRELTAVAETQKQIVDPTQLNQELLRMDWGLCYESLLQSTTETDRSVSLLPLADPATKSELLNKDSLFITPWADFPLEQVNERAYWTLPGGAYSRRK